MSEMSAHDLLITRDCVTPGCPNEALPGEELCSYDLDRIRGEARVNGDLDEAREYILKWMRAYHERTGDAPSPLDAAGDRDAPTVTAVRAVFPSWAAAVEAAGLPKRPPAGGAVGAPSEDWPAPAPAPIGVPRVAVAPSPRGKVKYTRQEMIDAYFRWEAEKGRPPTSATWNVRRDGWPTYGDVTKEFPGWPAFVGECDAEREARSGAGPAPTATLLDDGQAPDEQPLAPSYPEGAAAPEPSPTPAWPQLTDADREAVVKMMVAAHLLDPDEEPSFAELALFLQDTLVELQEATERRDKAETDLRIVFAYTRELATEIEAEVAAALGVQQ